MSTALSPLLDPLRRLAQVHAGTADSARNAPRHLAIVTGGSRGIGAGIVERLSADGHEVCLLARDEQHARATAERTGASFELVDVLETDALHRTILAICERAGKPAGILVANAGTARTAPFAKTDPALFRQQFDLNCVATAVAAQAVLPGMRGAGFGRIVSIASTAALKGYGYTAAYTASKHAVLGMTRALAIELAGTGITANAVCPGYVRTDMVERSAAQIAAKTGRGVEEILADMVADNPEKRFVTVAEVADTVAWLTGPDASAIQGQAIAVACGET